MSAACVESQIQSAVPRIFLPPEPPVALGTEALALPPGVAEGVADGVADGVVSPGSPPRPRRAWRAERRP